MLQALLVAVGAVALGYVVSKFLYKKDTEVEDRRRAAIDMIPALQAKGMTVLPELFKDYAVGDYSGMANKMKKAAVVLSNPASLEAEFASVFAKLLDAKLNDPVELEKLAALVAAKQTKA